MKISRITILLCFLLLGCSTVDNLALKAGYEKKSKLEQQIEDVKKDFDIKLAAKEKEINEVKDSIIRNKDKQMEAASDGLYGADIMFRAIMNPNRSDYIINNFVNESWAALGNHTPSYAKMKEINERIKTELDETKTSLEDLKKSNQTIIAENTKLVDGTKQLEKDLEAAKNEKQKITEESNNKIGALQTELNAQNSKVIALEKGRADEREANNQAIKEAKTKISLAAGILSAICIAGAIWSPLMKEKFGLGAAIFGLAAVGIWYLTPMIILAIFGIGIAIIVVWALLSHNNTQKILEKEKMIATDTYRAIQRIKEKSSDIYDKVIKPELQEAHMKYVEKDGKIEKEPDLERETFIDKRLAEVGDK